MTPEQILEYLKLKLRTTIEEIGTVTGMQVDVTLNLHDHLNLRESINALEPFAESHDFMRNEWLNDEKGGFYDFCIENGRVVIHDFLLPHERLNDHATATGMYDPEGA